MNKMPFFWKKGLGRKVGIYIEKSGDIKEHWQ